MAVATDFNVGAGVKAPRNKLMTFVNVGTSSTPEYEILGRGVEDSSIDLNADKESVKDILGHTETTVNGWEATQSFEPFTVRGGSKLALALHRIWQNKQPELLSKFDVLIVYGYIDGTATGSFEAELQSNCTIDPQSIGGSAYVDMPIEVSYSNDSVLGTVVISDGVPTFTPA